MREAGGRRVQSRAGQQRQKVTPPGNHAMWPNQRCQKEHQWAKHHSREGAGGEGPMPAQTATGSPGSETKHEQSDCTSFMRSWHYKNFTMISHELGVRMTARYGGSVGLSVVIRKGGCAPTRLSQQNRKTKATIAPHLVATEPRPPQVPCGAACVRASVTTLKTVTNHRLPSPHLPVTGIPNSVMNVNEMMDAIASDAAGLSLSTIAILFG